MVDKFTGVILIIAAGFEQRCLEFSKQCVGKKIFDSILLIDYIPRKNPSRRVELEGILRNIVKDNNIISIDYNRYNPRIFEDYINDGQIFCDCTELTIDISVMSKLLIMQLIYSLKSFNGKIRLIYSEPVSWAPSQDNFVDLHTDGYKSFSYDVLPSYGINNVVTTPLLSSIVMYKAPVTLIAFLSFNEQLLRSLINEINFSELILINKFVEGEDWREIALVDLNKQFIDQYRESNETFESSSKLVRRVNILDFRGTIKILSDIYLKRCYSNRIVLSPSGSKIQTVGCAIFKICCPDVHIEYPIPESYFIDGFTSSEVRKIHEIEFNNFNNDIEAIMEEYNLNI